MKSKRWNCSRSTVVLVVLLLALAGCSSGDTTTDEEPAPTADEAGDVGAGQDDPPEAETEPDDGDDGVGASDVCSPLLATSATVGEVFGASVTVQFDSQTATEMAGPVRRCMYTLDDAAAEFVEVDYLGTADTWSDIRDAYEELRGPLTDVDGVGDEAFHPDGRQHLVVVAGDTVFSVDTFEGEGSEEEVVELARRIAADAG